MEPDDICLGDRDQSANPFVFPMLVSGTCPTDGTVVEADDLVGLVLFPEHADAVLHLLRLELNRRSCPLCGEAMLISVPIVVWNSECRRGLLLGGDQTVESLLSSLVSFEMTPEEIASYIDAVRDYEALRIRMLPWIQHYLDDLLEAMITGLIVNTEPAERLQRLTPLRLRLLRMFGTGELSLTLQLSNEVSARISDTYQHADDPQLAHLDRQSAGLVHRVVMDLLTEALSAGRLATVFDEVAARVHPELADDTVLRIFADDCHPLTDVVEKNFLSAYGDQLANAIAHAISGRPNPMSRAWADFLRRVWKLWRMGGNESLEDLLPVARVAPSFTRFEDLWDACVPEIAAVKDSSELELMLRDVSEMMEQLGFQENLLGRFKAGIFHVQGEVGEDAESRARQIDALADAMRESLNRRFEFNISLEQSRALGDTTGEMVAQLAREGMLNGALRLVHGVLADALEDEDYVAAYSAGSGAIAALNEVEAWNEALEIADVLTECFESREVSTQLEAAGVRLTVSFWNETGNVLRYIRHREAALEAYGIARGFLELIEDPDERAADDAVLTENEARVYREQGRYGLALAILSEHTVRTPNRAELWHGVAITQLETNQLEAAKTSMDEALAAWERSPHPHAGARLLGTRACVRARLGDLHGACADLRRAETILPEGAADSAVRVAVVAAIFLGGEEEARDLLERCEERLWSVVVQIDPQRPPNSSQFTAVTALGELLLAKECEEAIERLDRQHLSPLLTRKDEAPWPWRLSYLKARIDRRAGLDHDSWRGFHSVLEALEESVPGGEDVAHSVGWLADKEGVQTTVADAAVDLVNRQLVTGDALPPVYEFANGRALGARIASRRPPLDVEASLAERLRIAAEHRDRDVIVVFAVDTPHHVQLACLRAGDTSPRLLADAQLDAAEVEAASAQFIRAMAYANPAAPERLDAATLRWQALATSLGSALAPELPVDGEVCFLPGRRLSALPLHLVAPMSGQPLIANHPVLVAANFALLLDELPGAAPVEHERLVVSVAKVSDSERFRERLETAAAGLAEAGPVADGALRLDGKRATLSSVTEGLATSREVFLLCHGTYGGQVKGYGVCVSDGRRLPPPLLSVDDAPSLSRFVLGWDDLEELPSAPSLLVSIACSSGRVAVAPGGVRLGLEQSLFAAGTRAIVSPLWDVDQAAALAWMNSFETARSSMSRVSDAHREACLASAEHYPHPYFWAPFTVSGSLFGEAI